MEPRKVLEARAGPARSTLGRIGGSRYLAFSSDCAVCHVAAESTVAPTERLEPETRRSPWESSCAKARAG
jgi:hypothetical protein